MKTRHATLACALALAAAACGAARSGEPSRSGSAPADLGLAPLARSWTSEFERAAVLVADEIRIEGPPGLLDHVASQQDPGRTHYAVRTVSEGLLQETTARNDLGPIEIQAQLDNWTVVALRRLVVLERPGDVPVSVRASGQAWWKPLEGAERRGAVLSFVGATGP